MADRPDPDNPVLPKRPASMWYWSDHQREPSLRALRVEHRGLWLDLLGLMHDGSPYGHLRIGAVSLGPDEVARIVGEPVTKVRKLMRELEAAGTFSRTPDGTIYSRRMVRDEAVRRMKAAAGRRGGEATARQEVDRVLSRASDDQIESALAKFYDRLLQQVPQQVLQQNDQQKQGSSSSVAVAVSGSQEKAIKPSPDVPSPNGRRGRRTLPPEIADEDAE